VFLDPFAVPDDRPSIDEFRVRTTGDTVADRPIIVAHTDRGDRNTNVVLLEPDVAQGVPRFSGRQPSASRISDGTRRPTGVAEAFGLDLRRLYLGALLVATVVASRRVRDSAAGKLERLFEKARADHASGKSKKF
jgi:hypothetical protein